MPALEGAAAVSQIIGLVPAFLSCFNSQTSCRSEAEHLIHKAREELLEAFRILDESRDFFPQKDFDRHAGICTDIMRGATDLKVEMNRKSNFLSRSKEMKRRLKNAKKWELQSFVVLEDIRAASWAAKSEYMAKASTVPKQNAPAKSLNFEELSELMSQLISTLAQTHPAPGKEAASNPFRDPLTSTLWTASPTIERVNTAP